MAYLRQVKAKGYYYIYLERYTNEGESIGKCQRVYGFGRKESLLLRLKEWKKDFPNKFPKELLRQGYNKNDLLDWIKTLETGITKTGRSKKFKIS